jgi:hypothetical protein
MIPLCKGKNPIYFGVIMSKVKVTIIINRIFDNGRFHMITLVLYIGSWPHDCPFEEEESYLFWGQRSRSLLL